MKKLILKPQALLAIAVLAIALWSCSKNELTKPAVPPQTQELSADETLVADDEALRPGEVEARQPSPGLYRITKFIDTGDNETAQFNGYTFRFRANGVLVATTNTGAVHTGSWSLNSAETMMTIDISGNEALDDLEDDDWNVVRITNQRIKIRVNDPDVVVFEKI